MTKLAVVRSALAAHPSAVIVAERIVNYLPDCDRAWGATADFFVAPKTGLYTAAALQAFMLSLIPGLEPTSTLDFTESGNSLEFGRLTFDEVIGRVSCRREITLSDRDLFSTPEFADGKLVIAKTSDIARRTWVNLFPDVETAEGALRGVHIYAMSKVNLPPAARKQA